MKIENNIIPQISTRQVQGNQQQNLTKNNKQSFTGFSPVGFMNFLDTSPAWGACFVDLGFMVLPRTATDFGRGANAGFETMRREGTGTANHSSIGLYGSAAGLALASGLNSAYNLSKNDVRAHKIFADTETLDLYGKIYSEKLSTNNPIKEYLKDALKRYETIDGVKFSNETVDEVANVLESEIKANSNKISKVSLKNLRAKLINATGVSSNLRISTLPGEGAHTSKYTVDDIISNLYNLGKVFTKDKVKETFENLSDGAQSAFIKSLKTLNKNRSLIGIGTATAIGVSTQPINMYLTKKKTGESGFVGGGKEDKSAKFKAIKAAVAGLFGAGVLASINPSTLLNPKNLIKDLQFKGKTPTIKQFKFVYGLTIMSRFLAARNDNELKEATIKDTLGFANWLILGNFVQKLVAQSFDKSLIKNRGNSMIEWFKNSSLKSREEVLHAALGKNVFKNGKALGLVEMIKALPKNSPAKKQLAILTGAQIANYLYSGLVLGIGIPKLNIYLTKRRMAKQTAAEAAPAIQQSNAGIKAQEFGSKFLIS